MVKSREYITSCEEYFFKHTATTEKASKRINRRHRNRSVPSALGTSMAEICLLARWCPVHRWRDSIPGSGTELENLPAVLREKAQADAPRGRKYRSAGQRRRQARPMDGNATRVRQ